MIAAARRLDRCQKGASTIEFALVAPIFFMLLMGIFDVGQMVYARAVLNGAVQKAARSSALETANTSSADAMVTSALRPIVPHATVSSTRQSYFDFADIGRREHWNDCSTVCEKFWL